MVRVFWMKEENMLLAAVTYPHSNSAEVTKMVSSVTDGRQWTKTEAPLTFTKVERAQDLQKPWLALRTHHVARAAIPPSL